MPIRANLPAHLGLRKSVPLLLGLAFVLWLCLSGAQAQMNLSTQLRQTIGDIVNLRNISVQFLQGGGRWFPAPKGDDAELANGLRDLQDRVTDFKKDFDNQESIETLKYDMDQVNRSYDEVDAILPKVGGNADVAKDWSIVQNDVAGIRQTFDAIVANSQGSVTKEGEHTPTVPELTQALGAETHDFKMSLGQFLNMPTRIPPAHEEDLMLVQTLKQFEQLLSKFGLEVNNGRPAPILREEVKQMRYVARKMDPFTEAIGADENTLQKWQRLRGTVDELHTLIGNKPENSDAPYLEAVPETAAPPDGTPGVGQPAGSAPGYGAPLPQGDPPPGF